MSEITNIDKYGPVFGGAVDIIDRTLGNVGNRELVTTDEISDALLDVRNILGSAVTGTFIEV